MNPKNPRRGRPISQRGAPHKNDGDAPIAPTVTMQRGHDGSSSSDDPSTPALSSAGSLWSLVGREIASWRRGTISIHEVDAWLRFNPYIRRGFRHRFLRKREALGSLVLYLHNETFNIASHLAMAALLVLLLLWPPQVPAMSSGGVPDAYDGAFGGCGLHTTASARGHVGGCSSFGEGESSVPLGRHRREDTGVPSWLRGLHGLVAASSATAARKDDDGKPGYVPPSDAVASPRHLLSITTAGAAASSSTFRFSFLLGGSALSSSSVTSSASMLSGIDTAPPPPPPMSVAARLTLSLTPLLLSFLLTFALSALYHMFMPCCRSRRGYQQLLQCDVMGVIFSISASAYTYFTCGMPCADEYVQAWSGALMVVATLLCIYVLVLAPMWGALVELCAHALSLAQWVAAAVMAAALEFSMGRPLLAAPLCPPPEPRSGDNGDRRPPSPGLQTGQHFLLDWVQRHRCLSSVRLSGASTARPSVEPVHVSAPQRVAVAGTYCLLHLCVYLTLVYPKRRPDMGGFTQATHYHSASYVWLFLGGLINAARFPEAIVFHWTRRAARHTRRVAAAEEAAWCAEELRRDTAVAEVDARAAAAAAASSSSHGSARSAPPPSVNALTLRERLCIPKLMVTHVVSASTLDYIGNSHNIWHVCTVLSALSAILAVYYDCIEYDLVQCS